MRLWQCLRGFLRDVIEPPAHPTARGPVVDARQALPEAQVAAHCSAARQALLLGDDEAALASAREAAERAPGDLIAGYLLGRALGRLGRHAEARAAFAAARDPFGLAAGWLAEVDRRAAEAEQPWPNRDQQAGVELERAARAALRAGRPDEALAAAEEAVARDPSNLMAAHLLGCALIALGRPAHALAVFERARRHDRVGLVDGWLAAAREGRLPAILDDEGDPASG